MNAGRRADSQTSQAVKRACHIALHIIEHIVGSGDHTRSQSKKSMRLEHTQLVVSKEYNHSDNGGVFTSCSRDRMMPEPSNHRRIEKLRLNLHKILFRGGARGITGDKIVMVLDTE